MPGCSTFRCGNLGPCGLWPSRRRDRRGQVALASAPLWRASSRACRSTSWARSVPLRPASLSPEPRAHLSYGLTAAGLCRGMGRAHRASNPPYPFCWPPSVGPPSAADRRGSRRRLPSLSATVMMPTKTTGPHSLRLSRSTHRNLGRTAPSTTARRRRPRQGRGSSGALSESLARLARPCPALAQRPPQKARQIRREARPTQHPMRAVARASARHPTPRRATERAVRQRPALPPRVETWRGAGVRPPGRAPRRHAPPPSQRPENTAR